VRLLTLRFVASKPVFVSLFLCCSFSNCRIQVQTVPQAGWAGVKNGRLLRLTAVAGNCNVFLTMDKSLPHQQRFENLPFAVVILRAGSNHFEDTRPLMPAVRRRLSEFVPGQLFIISSGKE
jgi:hypothetical protein